jgi:hypothetical protein
MTDIKLIRVPLHRYTFSIRPVRTWVENVCEGKVLNLFCGPTKLNVNEYRVDLDPDVSADSHMDALEFVEGWTGPKFGTTLLDPPYGLRKSMEMYGGRISSPFRRLKDALPRILLRRGLVVTFGYHAVSMGRERGFELERVLLMSHGGAIHDTIASVERRMKRSEKRK